MNDKISVESVAAKMEVTNEEYEAKLSFMNCDRLLKEYDRIVNQNKRDYKIEKDDDSETDFKNEISKVKTE